jgi:TatD DNase family protein
MAEIRAVCVSDKKGTAKKNVYSATLLVNHGLEQDAHAGSGPRQVSLLSYEQIEKFRAGGASVTYGCFGENIVASGIDFAGLPVGTRLSCADVLLEITQIGKECRRPCRIFQSMGECIMPTQGVFAGVLRGGTIKVGDAMRVLGEV